MKKILKFLAKAKIRWSLAGLTIILFFISIYALYNYMYSLSKLWILAGYVSDIIAFISSVFAVIGFVSAVILDYRHRHKNKKDK